VTTLESKHYHRQQQKSSNQNLNISVNSRRSRFSAKKENFNADNHSGVFSPRSVQSSPYRKLTALKSEPHLGTTAGTKDDFEQRLKKKPIVEESPREMFRKIKQRRAKQGTPSQTRKSNSLSQPLIDIEQTSSPHRPSSANRKLRHTSLQPSISAPHLDKNQQIATARSSQKQSIVKKIATTSTLNQA
jgi:hypothetical protein